MNTFNYINLSVMIIIIIDIILLSRKKNWQCSCLSTSRVKFTSSYEEIVFPSCLQ